jgi:protein O-GlcNAc transferase
MRQRRQAIPRFREAVRLSKLNASAHFHLGAALWLENDRDEAVRHLAEASKLTPANAEYWQRYAVAARENGQRGDALKAYRRVVALRPGCLECRNALSFLLTDQGKALEGEREAVLVLKRDARNLAAYSNLGFAYLQQNELGKAIDTYRKGLAVAPDSAVMQYNLGLAYKQKDELELAREHLRRALELDGQLIEAHYTLGIVEWQNGEFEVAAGLFEKAVRIAPDYADAWAMYGTVLRQQGELARAREALGQAIRLKPDDPGPYSQMGQLLRVAGEAEESAKYLAMAAERKAAKEAMQKAMFDRSNAPKPRVIQ